MTQRRSQRSALGALAVSACLALTACGGTSASSSASNSTSPSSAGPPASAAAQVVGAASSSALPVEPSAALSAAATGEVNPAPSATGAVGACALVTEQEAATALGGDPGPGTQTALEGTATACTYRAGGSTLQFSLTRTDGKATYEEQHAHIPSAAASFISDLPGIGDSAFGQFQGPRGAINFDKGDALVVMGLNLAGATDPPRDQLVVLATTAAGRI